VCHFSDFGCGSCLFPWRWLQAENAVQKDRNLLADDGGQKKICLKQQEMKDLTKKNGGIIAVERNRMG
jgi:hypothetical protein